MDVGDQHGMRHAKVRARAEHGRLWGKLYDDDGNQAATFSAGLGANGVEGTFTTSDGETGSFTWDGVLPPTPTP